MVFVDGCGSDGGVVYTDDAGVRVEWDTLMVSGAMVD